MGVQRNRSARAERMCLLAEKAKRMNKKHPKRKTRKGKKGK